MFPVSSHETSLQKDAPKVSIGLAVYNGEKYLEQAIESILSQTFGDFELIISDNASTDRTSEICMYYASRDARIRYSRNQTNIGGANNENLTFMLARGEYFRWAAHDDVCAPDLIRRLVQALDENPEAVLAMTIIMNINDKGEPLGIVKRTNATTGTPSQRFCSLTNFNHYCEATYGLIRSDVMRKTDLQRNYTDSDRTFLCQLSLMGRFILIDEVLFYRRLHSESSTQVYSEWRARMAWFGERSEKKITFPYWMQFLHLLSIIFRSSIGFREKLRCYLHIFTDWMQEWGRWRKLVKDVLLAGEKVWRFYLFPSSMKNRSQAGD